MNLMEILQQAAGGNVSQAGQHYEQVVQHATPDQLARGVSGVFRSPDTPPAEQMVSQLFGNSNSVQQAGMLNQLMRVAGPALMAYMASGALKKVMAGSGQANAAPAQVTPAQAAQVTPEQVAEVVKHAEATQPGIVDHLSQFYADHPTLVKTIGGAALAVLLTKMKDGMVDRS
jgi:hypothetical protein